MFPAQTSMMPVNVALARFVETHGFGAAFSNYPYWYLGSTPFRYLTGPVVPSILVLFHRLLPNFSLFEIMLGVTMAMWIVGGVGVWFLAKELGLSKEWRGREAVFGAVFYLFGPVVPFLFPFADGVYLLAFSVLPFILFFYLKFLKNPTRRLKFLLVGLMTFVLLIDTLIIPSLLLGMAAVFLAQVGWKKTEEKLKSSLVLLFLSFLVSTLWYTPGYWLTTLGAPSFGGKGLAQVVGWLGKIMPIALGLTLAIFSAKVFKKRDLLRDFCFYWLFIFGFLTLMRFLSDPDFWQDWTGYGLELQLGLAMGLGLITQILNVKSQNYISKLKNFSILIAISTFYFLLSILIFNKYVLGTLQKDITQTVEHRVGKWLSENAEPGEKVFLSGTTAFWLNALFDIPQVRGGRDQASFDARWREAVWEIREGTNPEKSVTWLKELDIKYLVVHTGDSKEFYHDFVYPEKFEKAINLRRVYWENGDAIYRIE